MTTGAQFIVRQVGNVQVIEFSRDAHHLNSVDPSREVLYSLIESSPEPKCILDLHNVTWAGSKLIGVIMQFHLLVLRHHGALRLCGLQPHMKEILDLTRLTTILSIHDTCENALKSFK